MIFEKQILKRYRAAAFRRYDDTGTARYFGPEDFPGLIAEPVSFPNRAGDLLAGWFYSCFAPKEGRLVVFDHGIGGGHRSYMKEIALLAEAGYRVFAYDHTGCMASGGECTRGMSGSLADLDDALSYLRETHGIPDESISVIGHSWGGFAALNISRYHPFLSHVVAISGFLSVPRLLASSLGGFPLPAPYREAICALERDVNPGYADSDAISSLAGSGAKVLLIYSDNDPEKAPLRSSVRSLFPKEQFHLPSGKGQASQSSLHPRGGRASVRVRAGAFPEIKAQTAEDRGTARGVPRLLRLGRDDRAGSRRMGEDPGPSRLLTLPAKSRAVENLAAEIRREKSSPEARDRPCFRGGFLFFAYFSSTVGSVRTPNFLRLYW